MPRSSVAKKTIDVDARTVTFDFGEKVGAVISNLNHCTPEMVLRYALHGACQKHGDAYSGCAGDAIVAAAACTKSVEQVEGATPKWTDRKAGVPGLPSVFVEAVQRQQLAIHDRDLSFDAVKDKLEAMTDDKRKALKQNAKLGAIMAEIRAERATAKATVDTDTDADMEALD